MYSGEIRMPAAADNLYAGGSGKDAPGNPRSQSRARPLHTSRVYGILVCMSLAEVQSQAAALGPEERRKLAAFLVTLRMKETGEWVNATSEEQSDEQAGWISLEEAKRRLSGSA